MKKSHKLTIVLLTYNRARSGYLRKALDAILNQTYKDFELLVFDNYSEDNTAEVVLSYDDSRLYYVRQPKGGNPTTSYNHALWISRGKYVIFTHDDDIMNPTLIEEELKLFKNYPDLLAVASNVSLIDESDQVIQEKLYQLNNTKVFKKGEYLEKYFSAKLWFPTPTIMYHRDTYFNLLRKYLSQKKPEYFASGDIWAMFNMNLKGPIGLLAEPLLQYRQHKNQESRNVDQSNPVLDVIKMFLNENKNKKRFKLLLPSIFAYLTRFKLQDILFNSKNKNEQKKEIKLLYNYWTNNVLPKNRAVDAILPVEIFINLLGLKPTIHRESFSKLCSLPAQSGARKGFRNWLNIVYEKGNIFQFNLQVKKVAIFGSMLNSFLLVQSAKQAGIDVVYCFDSSPARIGKQVLGVKVLALSELKKHCNEFGMIILSNEHDQEDAVKKIITNYLPLNNDLIVLSWKDLAERM